MIPSLLILPCVASPLEFTLDLLTLFNNMQRWSKVTPEIRVWKTVVSVLWVPYSLSHLLLGKSAATVWAALWKGLHELAFKQTLTPQPRHRVTAASVNISIAHLWDTLNLNHLAKLFPHSSSTKNKLWDDKCFFSILKY